MNEAPFSWNTRYRHPDGWTCQLTIRDDESGKSLFAKVDAALAWLAEKGCTPAEGYHANSSNGNHNGNAPPMCPTHGTPMKPSKHGGWYCPVKVADDDGTGKPVYCKQKVAA